MTHTADNTDRQETTAMSDVRINLAGPNDQTIHLDGEDISKTVAAVNIQAAAGKPPRVTVDFAINGCVTTEGKTEVYMSLATSNLLRRAGWTPPEGSRLGAEPIKLAPGSSVGGTTTSSEEQA